MQLVPDCEKRVDHKGGIGDPLKPDLLRQMEHHAWIGRCIKTEPKRVKCQDEETRYGSVKKCFINLLMSVGRSKILSQILF